MATEPNLEKIELTAQQVNRLHRRSDVDSSINSQHHTLGVKATQGAPGNHTHNGTNSKSLLAGIILSGSKGGNAALASVILALTKLGATDATT
jgi:hypothetical protein